VRPGIIRMHDQLAIALRCINRTPFGQRREYLGDMMYVIEFTPFFETIDSMETAEVPNYRQHEFLRLDRLTFPFRNFFSLWQPNGFAVHGQVKP
jgi:hypothetical protein